MTTAADPGDAPRHPNVVLIVTDQQRRDHVGWADERFRTPHLDALARRGTVFSRAIVSNPICMPNRATLATGRMPSVHGTRFNGLPLDDRARTFMHALSDAGYRTGLVGKSHLQNMGDHPEIIAQIVDRTLRHDAVAMPDDGWDSWELKSRYDDPDADHDVPAGWYGFDHVELAIDHGDVVGGHYAQWLAEHGIDPQSVRGPEHALEVDATWSEIRQPAVAPEHYHSAWAGQRAAAFIESADDRPFFLQVSFPDPHHPFTPPGEFWRSIDHADLDPPPTFDDGHADSMPHLRRRLDARGVQAFHLAAFSPTREQFQRALAAEIATISLIDDAVGEVIAAFDRRGVADETVIVFTSDHGDMFGDHGLILKAGMHYEACLGTPLVVAGPGVRAGTTASLASTIDIPSTVCSLAGVEPFWGMQGHDLSPILADPTSTVRDSVLVEEDQIFDIAELGQPLRMRTLVTDDGRITRYGGTTSGELFDLRSDPDERRNIDAKPEGEKMRAEMIERLADSMSGHADRDRRPAHMA